jgi:deoxyribodipyrimidine photo-lyase
MDAVQVVWFKRDLRLHDHAPLVQATRRGPVLPLYVVEPGLVRRPDYGPAHWTFVRESLRELRAGLAALGQPLLVRTGDPVAILTALREAVPFVALWAHEETGREWTFARDRAVRAWARARGIPFAELPQHGVIRGFAAHHPTRAGWAAGWEERMRGPALAPPAALPPIAGLAPGSLPTHQQLGLPPDDRVEAQAGGEAAGRALRDSFLAGRGAGYRRAMSGPNTAPDACSRLSPHLAWGTVSLRETVQAVREARKSVVGGPSSVEGMLPLLADAPNISLTPDNAPVTTDHGPRITDFPRDLNAFESRLHWHCHFMQKLEDEGRIERESLVAPLDELRTVELGPLLGGPDAAARLAAWAAGCTGYPLIDACMRALRGTGWLPFRMRALLVSFAAHDLWLPWQEFSDLLARRWLDYEPGIHLCQVQMQSGVTAGDALRLYNPTKQATDHDPAGTFIRRWVPELRRVPLAYLHQPWTLPPDEGARLGCVVGRDYPLPIVDHEAASRAARAAIAALRRRPDVLAATAAMRARHSDPRRAGTRPARPDAVARRRAQGQLSLF